MYQARKEENDFPNLPDNQKPNTVPHSNKGDRNSADDLKHYEFLNNLHLDGFPVLVLKGKPSKRHLMVPKEKPMRPHQCQRQCDGGCFSEYDSSHEASQELLQGPGRWKIAPCCRCPAWNELRGLREASEHHESIIFPHSLPHLILLSHLVRMYVITLDKKDSLKVAYQYKSRCAVFTVKYWAFWDYT